MALTRNVATNQHIAKLVHHLDLEVKQLRSNIRTDRRYFHPPHELANAVPIVQSSVLSRELKRSLSSRRRSFEDGRDAMMAILLSLLPELRTLKLSIYQPDTTEADDDFRNIYRIDEPLFFDS